jgi:hypothetical protein
MHCLSSWVAQQRLLSQAQGMMNAYNGLDRAKCVFIKFRQFGSGFDLHANFRGFSIEYIKAMLEFLVSGRRLESLV